MKTKTMKITMAIYEHVEDFGIAYIAAGLMFFPAWCLLYDAAKAFIANLI